WEIFTSSAELPPLKATMSQPVLPLPITPPCQPNSPLMGGRTPLPLALSVSAISADLAYAMASKFAPSGSFLDGLVFKLPTTSILEDHDWTLPPSLLDTMATPLTLSSAARFCMAAKAWSATAFESFHGVDGGFLGLGLGGGRGNVPRVLGGQGGGADAQGQCGQ